MNRSTVNTVVTLAVVGAVSILYAKALFPKFFEKTPEPTARVLVPAPTKDEGEAALAKMRIVEDKVDGLTRYRAKSTPTNMRGRTGIYLTFIKFPPSFGSPAVGAAMHVVYSDSDWIFFESLVSNCDGAKFEFELKPEHHVGASGQIEEWASVAISKRVYFEFLYDCAIAKDSTIRLNGKFFYDHKMSPKEKQAILDTLTAFLAMGGSFDLPYE